MSDNCSNFFKKIQNKKNIQIQNKNPIPIPKNIFSFLEKYLDGNLQYNKKNKFQYKYNNKIKIIYKDINSPIILYKQIYIPEKYVFNFSNGNCTFFLNDNLLELDNSCVLKTINNNPFSFNFKEGNFQIIPKYDIYISKFLINNIDNIFFDNGNCLFYNIIENKFFIVFSNNIMNLYINENNKESKKLYYIKIQDYKIYFDKELLFTDCEIINKNRIE